MEKTYIGLISKNRRGKDSVGELVIELAAPRTVQVIRFSDSLNRILEGDLGLGRDRTLQQGLSTGVRREYGQDVLSKRVYQDALESEADIVIINGVRRPADVELLRSLPNFKLVRVTASPDLAYEWMKRANDREGDAEKSFEQFLEEDSREPEKLIDQTAESADATIANDEDDAQKVKLRVETKRMLAEQFGI
jgi:hypothetical protein